MQKYDIRRPAAEGGGFEERFWNPINSPVLGPDGRLAYIIHRVEDATRFMRLKPEARRSVDLIANAAAAMNELLEDLLRLSRLGRQALKKETVSPAEVAHQVLEDFLAEQNERQVEVRLGELPPCKADRALLRQVYFNLISNAFKYTRRRDRPVIEIGSRRDNNEPVFYVRDNGTGFDMQYVDKLFGVFQRLHSREDYEGTGVGLAIVQRIIHRHGGRIAARSEVNRGAEFYFTLGS